MVWGAELSVPPIRVPARQGRRDIAAAIADRPRVVSRLEATVAELNETIAERDARIAKLEAVLGEPRRTGNRQRCGGTVTM